MKTAITRPVVVLLVLVALAGTAVFPGCSNKYFHQAVSVVGEEAAYAALKTSLTTAGLKSADHLVDAVRLVADKKDYGGAVAALAVALEDHNVRSADKLTSSQVLSLLRRAEPSVRKANARVAGALASFCDYAAANN